VTHGDAFGHTLALGDRVVFMLRTGSQPGSKSLVLGTVVRFTPKAVEVEYTDPRPWYAKRGTEKRLVYAQDGLVKYTPPPEAIP
jgi:hypothetical protein